MPIGIGKLIHRGVENQNLAAKCHLKSRFGVKIVIRPQNGIDFKIPIGNEELIAKRN